MGTSVVITGYLTQEQAKICIDHCEHPECIINGEPYRGHARCALERWVNQNAAPVPRRIPRGFLSIRQVAERLERNISYDTMRNWLHAGKVPGARKLGPHRTAPWAIPVGALDALRNME